MTKTELPIFSDNLKSSASWVAVLGHQREVWRTVLESARTDVEDVETRIRELQAREILQRTGQGIDKDRLINTSRLVSGWIAEENAELTAGRLFEIYGALNGATANEDALRKTEPLPINPMHDPTPALILPRMIDNAFDWFSTPSFNELHPVEQASVVFLRLLDLHPFPSRNEDVALFAAGFYTERAGLPQLVIFSDETTVSRYVAALDAAFRMLTQPLVEFFAEMLGRVITLQDHSRKLIDQK